jgi:hypothetical protein
MPAGLSPPVVSEVPTTASVAIDHAFEQRWNAWRDRGIRDEIAVRRQVRFAALAVAIVAGSIYVGLRLLGGTS